jgi:hypothetical protein
LPLSVKALRKRLTHGPLWRGIADADLLADSIVQSDADLFALDGQLVWLDGDVLTPVTKTTLAAITTRFVCYKVLV